MRTRNRLKVQVKSFRPRQGDAEHFLAVRVDADRPFAEQLRKLEDAYRGACADLGLPMETAVFRRVFVSDILNQGESVRASQLFGDEQVALSLIQQQPLDGSKLALCAYHAEGISARRRLSEHHLVVERGDLRHLWTTGLHAAPQRADTDAAMQTSRLFRELVDMIHAQGGTLADNCVRTWLFLKDVDVFYSDMVRARTQLFESEGLTADTHYIASTGIGGMGGHQYALVTLEALSILGLVPAQIAHLNDFTRLSRTIDYNVTFERATRVGWRDRSHIYISGTASIDSRGEVVHAGDVARQLGRAVENIDALLAAGDARLADLMYVIVYLRDAADYHDISGNVERLLPGVPKICVAAPVCRPGWLVEIEGVACAASADANLPRF